MKLKKRKKDGFSETAASSDLAFILIIYFLVIAGFNINLGFLMNLPERDSMRLILRDDLLRFEMDHNGAVYYNDLQMSVDGAEREIRAAVASNPNLAVVLMIDARAPWQQVVLFVELAQKLRVDSFSFNLRESS